MKNVPNLSGKTKPEDRKWGEKDPSAAASGPAPDPDADFVITEAHDNDTELVGGFKRPTPDNDLGIESTADLMQNEAVRGTDPISNAFDDTDRVSTGPGTRRDPALAEPAFDYPPVQDESFEIAADQTEPPADPDGVEKLSKEKLAEISSRMKAEAAVDPSAYLSEEEKFELLHRIESCSPDPTLEDHPRGFDSQPIVPPKKKDKPHDHPIDVDLAGERPKIAKRVRGIAYFAKGFIQIKGEQELHEYDELMVNGREYILRRKQFGSKTVLSVIAPIAAAAAFLLGLLLSTGADTGQGRIIGLVVNEYDQPVISGAAVHIPQTGQTIEVNGQGFFRTDGIAGGSYEVEYILDGQVVSTDYATVADGEITTLILRPSQPSTEVEQTQPAYETPAEETQATQTRPATTRRSNQAATPTRSSGTQRTESARITLAANVEGARFAVDGKMLGAGNMTYSDLKAGQHTYRVTRDGYDPVEGKVTLRAGQTRELEVTLTPVRKESVPRDVQLYRDAVALTDKGDYAAAVPLLSEAIKIDADDASVYLARADAYRELKNRKAALEDYVQAGSLLTSSGKTSQALATYDKAVALDAKSFAAYLGRGYTYLERREEIAAVADFDMVVRLDKRNVAGHIGLGLARLRQNSFDKATGHFKDARSIDAENPLIHQYLMLSLFSQGDYKQARKSYEKFLSCASEQQVRALSADPAYREVLRAVAK